MSGAIDEDTARAINSGRETLGAMFSSAQADLQKVFIVFVAGFLGTFYALRIWVWDFLKQTAQTNMGPELASANGILTKNPFEVILLQAKIGMFFGVVLAIPALLFFSRDALKRRGVSSSVPISPGLLAGFVLASLSLFAIGVVYAYAVFFPFTFLFLADIAYSAGVKPTWGITEFTQFVALLTISFGLAAQLPLFMATLSYTEIVPYETFRDKWRHAIVATTVFGALFSPPDPITQIMWALPLVFLYGFSLGLAKLVANTRRRGAAEVGSGVGHVKRRALQLLGVVFLVFAGAAIAIAAGVRDWIGTTIVPQLPAILQPSGPTTIDVLIAEHGTLGIVASAALVATGAALLVLVVLVVQAIRTPVYPRESSLQTAQSPADVDFEVIDASDVERIPAPVFTKLSEDEMMDVAREAMHADDREKAQAIIDRFDTLSAIHEDDASTAEAATETAESGEPADDSEGVFASTAAGMVDPFTEEETTEEDIGGYAYDVAFIVDSLTSKVIYIVGLFMVVMAGSFFWLYAGGIGQILKQFVDRVPDDLLREVATQSGANLDSPVGTTEFLQDSGFVIALHPVEVLIFIVKVSTLLGIVSVLPFVLYWAWPAAKERGLVRGDRRTFAVWGGGLVLGFGLGTFLGFYYIAPAVISYLITDAISNGMVVSYQMNSFFWLVIYTTLGVGFLFNIVVTMALFHAGGIVPYRSMLRHWRPIVVGIFTIAAFVSPRGLLTMFAIAIPLSLTYLLGLALLYVLTAGGRLFGGGGSEPVPDPEAGDAVAAGE